LELIMRRLARATVIAAVAAGAIMAGATGASAAEPSATCKDGTVSYSASRSGTCAHHGGVAAWRNRPPARSKAHTDEGQPRASGWDCRVAGNNVCGPGQAYAPGYYVILPGGAPYLIAPWRG